MWLGMEVKNKWGGGKAYLQARKLVMRLGRQESQISRDKRQQDKGIPMDANHL